MDNGNWNNYRVVVVDIEGNGRQPADIVEIAVLELLHGQIAGLPRSWLVKPAERITHFAKKVHGIGTKDVKDCPSFSDVADEVKTALGEGCMVAHNAAVELSILTDGRIGDWRPTGVVDTLALARARIPDQPSYALQDLVFALHLESQIDRSIGHAHRAAWDTMAAALLFIQMAIQPDGTTLLLSELLHKKLTEKYGIPSPHPQQVQF